MRPPARLRAVKVGALVSVFAAPATSATAVSATAASATGMSLFSNSNYGGCALYTQYTSIYTFTTLSYNAGTGCPRLNDSVSSIVNGFYISETFSTSAGYTGHTQTIAARSQVSGVRYNDQYSSYRP
jgi:hypothetical protein